jgi:hypothetical protein
VSPELVGLGVLALVHLSLLLWVCLWAQRDHRARERARAELPWRR